MSTADRSASLSALPERSELRGALRVASFLLIFLVAWWSLDRLAPNPLFPLPAIAALLVISVILAVGQVVVFRTEPRRIAAALGLGRPPVRALLVAVLVGGLVIATFLIGAALSGISLQLRPQWPLIALAALIFHGVAEEMVWRGYAFARLREGRTYWQAVWLSMPLITATHLPIMLTSGLLVGGLALVSAAVTCLPLAYLWERGRKTIWPPAIVHGLIDSWKIFERSYPPTFAAIVLLASILAPLIAFTFRDSWFVSRQPGRTHSA